MSFVAYLVNSFKTHSLEDYITVSILTTQLLVIIEYYALLCIWQYDVPQGTKWLRNNPVYRQGPVGHTGSTIKVLK